MSNQLKGTLVQFLGLIIVGLGIVSLIYSQNGGGVWFSILAFGFFGIGSPFFKIGAKIKQLTAEELLEKDKREPILLLRPFQRDNIDIRDFTGFSKDNMFSPNYYINKEELTFEEKIVETFNILGPVIAIGRPDGDTQLLGASRTYIPDNQWQDKVIRLASKSSYILFIVDDSPSLRWEFQEMVKLKSLDRLFLVLPPLKKNKEVPQSIKSFLSDMNILQNIKIDVVAITFNKNGNIELIKSSSNNILKRINEIEKYIKRNFEKSKIQPKKKSIMYKLLALIMITVFVSFSINKTIEKRENREYLSILNQISDNSYMKSKIIGKWKCIKDSPGFSKGNIIEFTDDTMNFVFEMPYRILDFDDSHIILETTLGDMKVKHFIEIIDDDTIKITGAIHKRINIEGR